MNRAVNLSEDNAGEIAPVMNYSGEDYDYYVSMGLITPNCNCSFCQVYMNEISVYTFNGCSTNTIGRFIKNRMDRDDNDCD